MTQTVEQVMTAASAGVTGTTGSLGAPQTAAVPVPENPPQAPLMPYRLPEIDPDEPVPDDPGPLLPDTPQTLPPPPAEPGPGQPINPEVEPV